MKKTLLLAAALACSGAAQAETFVCDTEVKADLGGVNMIFRESEFQNQYVIDTEKGTLIQTTMSSERIVNPEERDFVCSMEKDLIICLEDTGFEMLGLNHLSRFVIQTIGQINFSFTQTLLYGNARMNSSLGTCTKI
jgi:hypothetical protein